MSTDHLAGLNPPQREAVETITGPLLVLAGAGTGKTRVVTCRIAEILSKGVSPGAVCAVTFTNKAAREMKDRVRALLGRRDISHMVVSTFHSLGLRILREFGEHLGLRRSTNVADEADQLALTADALRETGLSRSVLRPQDARWRISTWKNAGLRPDEALAEAERGPDSALAVAYGRYDEELRRQGLLDFDDLILRPLDLFREAPEVLNKLRDRWRWLLVDEYQDTNGCQYEIIRLLAGDRRNVCAVGDDDQSIYGWRGADPERILRFTRDYSGATVITLDQNYRSTGRILEAANALIGTNTRRREKDLWSAVGPGERVDLYIADDEKDEVDFVTTRILLLRQQEGMDLEDCAILFRANSQCRPLEQALRQRQISYRVVGTRSFFDRREVRDLLAFVRIARNDNDDSALLRVINVPARGIGKGSVDKLSTWAAEARSSIWSALEQRIDDLPPRAMEGARALAGIVHTIRELATSEGVARALEWLVEETGYRDHLRQTTDDPLELDMRLGVVDDLVDTARTLGASGQSSLDAFLDSLALRDREQEKSDDGSPAITLLTMHAAKGLEFKVAFIVGMEEGTLPHQKSIASEDDDRPDSDAIEEERRLAYVGFTRARERLVLSYARERTRYGRTEKRTMSRFLEEAGSDAFYVTDSADVTPADPEMGKEMMRQIRARLGSEGSGGSRPPWWEETEG